MRYYIAICRADDHRLYADSLGGIQTLMEAYIRDHPQYTLADFEYFPIPRKQYKDWTRNRRKPLWWILQQGDPLVDMSPGRKEQVARMVTNIPPIPKGGRNIRKGSTR